MASGFAARSNECEPTASASIHMPGSTPASRMLCPSASSPDGNRAVLTLDQSPRCSCQLLVGSAAPNHPASTVATSMPISAAMTAFAAMTDSSTSWSS